jgi:hypothetical protein
MKHIHHLSTSGLLAATAVMIVIGETAAWYITRALDIRFPAFTIGVLCIGIVAAIVSIFYDGRD